MKTSSLPLGVRPLLLGSALWLATSLPSHAAVLKASDVVFMYEASADTYAAYGATVLAWGGKPNPKKLAEAKGVTWFGSVGMVTEFSAYHERFPDRYEEGLCRDIGGKPVKVPWLTDHQHKGVPYWWCCTRQPVFRQFLQDRVVATVQAGTHGIHIDDHLGTAGGLWLGICFCDRCVDGFREYLSSLPAEERTRLGVGAPGEFNYRDVVRQWLAQGTDRKVTGHPLWSHWSIYQCRGAAAFMMELRELAARTAGRPVPVGANAGLLWPRHLSDYQALDLFTAETDHHAAERRFADLPLVAYRLAEAMGRPYAATASGGDWAFVKEHNLPGLVRGWIALSYAAGQRLMAPHRQWCYTPEKGTHWYEGPAAKFAPLYQFVRKNAAWFDGYATHADLAVVLPHRSFARDPQRWFVLCNRLAAANLSYRLIVAGDEIVDRPLAASDLDSGLPLLVPERREFLEADRRLLESRNIQLHDVLRVPEPDRSEVGTPGLGRPADMDSRTASARRPRPGVPTSESGERPIERQRSFATVDEALAALRPPVKVQARATVRILPRVKPGSTVVHLLNYDYDAARDDVRPLERVQVQVDLGALGLAEVRSCRWFDADADLGKGAVEEPANLMMQDGKVELPRLGLWGLLILEKPGG